MAIAPLLSDGGEMTVLRNLAAYVWGRYSVTWPDDFTGTPTMPEGRELGFVAKLPAPPKGRFARRFVRADVDVNAVEKYSTMESTLDAAADRVSGDVLYSREIRGAGLGRNRYGVDFRRGDVVPVRVWGKILNLPVTAGTISGESSARDVAVHVGGQLLLDTDELSRRNAELDRAIAAERRERRKAIAAEAVARVEAIRQESTARTTAIKSAVDAEALARKQADEAEARTRASAIQSAISAEQATRTQQLQELNSTIDGVEVVAQSAKDWTVENQTDFNNAVSLFKSAQSSYNDINNIKWIDNTAWQAQQKAINDSTAESIKALRYAEILGRSREAQGIDFRLSFDGSGLATSDSGGYYIPLMGKHVFTDHLGITDYLDFWFAQVHIHDQSVNSFDLDFVHPSEVDYGFVLSASISNEQRFIEYQYQGYSALANNFFIAARDLGWTASDSKTIQVRISGFLCPFGIAPKYQAEIDALGNI